MSHPFPEVGSQWLNTRQHEVYRVTGYAAACTDDRLDVWDILYRSEAMPPDHYRHRSLSEWYGQNRDGDPRFVLVAEAERSTASGEKAQID